MIDSKYHHVIFGQGESFVMMYENGKVYREFEINGNRSDCRVHFCDGTVVRFCYGKPHLPDTWMAVVENSGLRRWKITRCDDPDSPIKSDVFESDSVIFCTRRTDKLTMGKKGEPCKYGESSEG